MCALARGCIDCLVGKFLLLQPCLLFLSLRRHLASCYTQTAYFLEGKKHKVPYLIVVDDFSDYVHCIRMDGTLAFMLMKKIRAVVDEHKSWGHVVGTIRSDSEVVYRSVKSDINHLGVRTQDAAPGVLEKKAEAMVKILSCHCEFAPIQSSSASVPQGT
jgi:hypothetical protein